MPTVVDLRRWDEDYVWHPFAPMQAFREEQPPIIDSAEGFELIDIEGRRYLDGISSLWCNVHGHRVPEIDAAIRRQLEKVSHTTLLGLSSTPAIELAARLVARAPAGLSHVFYSDSGSSAVEVALKMAFQYHQQNGVSQTALRTRFVTIGGAYHGDTISSVSVGSIELFHRLYGALLFETLSVPSPAALYRPAGESVESYQARCFEAVERVIGEHVDQIAAVVMEPLVQGAAGILVHPPGYLKHVRAVTKRYGIPLIADEVAVGFGRTGTLFACEQEQVQPDFLCLAKGLTGGYLPLAATLTTDEIFNAFLGAPVAGRTFFHGHTFTGNPLGCAAALASLELFETNRLLENIHRNSALMSHLLQPLADHPHVAEIRQKGIMVGIELVRDRDPLTPYSAEKRMGHQVTLAARERGVILRPLQDVVVLMPAPAMPAAFIERLCHVTLQSIQAVTGHVIA